MRQYQCNDATVIEACRTLFGSSAIVDKGFIVSIGHDELKSAFRKKAFETHPDLHGGTDVFHFRRQSDLFMKVREAHDVVLGYLQTRKRPMQESPGTKAAAAERSFSGAVPPRRLEIGGFLYYSGCIPYAALIKALAWQKQQRPSVGALAKQWSWLKDEQIHTITTFHGQPRLFGERAVHFRFLTEFQVRVLLAHQRKMQKRLGEYFVEQGLLSRDKMEEMVEAQKRHNAQLGMPTRKSA